MCRTVKIKWRRLDLKIFNIFVLLMFFLSSCSFAANNATIAEQPVVEKKKTAREKIEALSSEDPRRQRVMAVTWQIQYQREKLKNVELNYLTKCYQDKEYRNTLAEIDRLTKQLRQLLLL